MRTLLSLYTLRLPMYFVYMLQQVEYDPAKFHEWFLRLIRQGKPIQSVMTRQQLVRTRRAVMLMIAAYVFVIVVAAVYTSYVSVYFHWAIVTLVLLAALPQLVHLFLLALAYVAHRLIIRPQQRRLLADATRIFADHPGIKIAVLGSYGKTTMKELLAAVLAEGKKVAATPGNMNVSTSHARFAKKLVGDEDVIIVEFGEGEPGDIKRMAQMLKPDYAVITGLAPNHLDHYANLQAVADDLKTIYDFVDASQVFASGESAMLQPFLPPAAQKFSAAGVLDWRTRQVRVAVDSLNFQLVKAKKSLKLTGKLLGRHQVGPLSMAAALADQLGLKPKEIEAGIAKAKPFEHRMQPRSIHGAWLIDDTYNGNLEGMQAGLKLLKELVASRRWYVTPGLVDQGNETERVHTELGKAIAAANPDVVVLMENSVRPIIEKAMEANGFTGELRVETNPLEFYTTIEHVIAAGDIVLMQNDWTDNYA